MTTIIHKEENSGITGKSLRMLRNTLCNAINDEVCVIRVDTGDFLCGFLIIDKTKNSATWSGDGFRTDRGGEGGRGYKYAEKMIEEQFGYWLQFSADFTEKKFNANDYNIFLKELRNFSAEVLSSDAEFRVIADSTPHY